MFCGRWAFRGHIPKEPITHSCVCLSQLVWWIPSSGQLTVIAFLMSVSLELQVSASSWLHVAKGVLVSQNAHTSVPYWGACLFGIGAEWAETWFVHTYQWLCVCITIIVSNWQPHLTSSKTLYQSVKLYTHAPTCTCTCICWVTTSVNYNSCVAVLQTANYYLSNCLRTSLYWDVHY